MKVVEKLSSRTKTLVVKGTTRGSKKIEEAEEMGVDVVSLSDFLTEHGIIIDESEPATKKKEKTKKLDTALVEDSEDEHAVEAKELADNDAIATQVAPILVEDSETQAHCEKVGMTKLPDHGKY